MSFVAALLPVAIYIFVVYKLDSFSLVSVKSLLMLVLLGMASALVCFGLFLLTGQVLSDGVSELANPVVEEAVKAIPLYIMARRKKMVFFIDSVIFGAALGGGFSILENAFYLLMGEPLGIGTVLFRGLEVALVHMGCSATIAVVLMMSVRFNEHARAGMAVKGSNLIVFLVFFAAILHVVHNSFHGDPFGQFICVLGALSLLLFFVYQYDSGMIHRWVDLGLDQQVSLLRSIKDGQLGETPTGKFLMSVKENFPAEVFFDVICYVQLFVELSVAAKSRFMLREAGMDMPLEDSVKELYRSQYAEFKFMEKSLGKSVRMTVAPIVMCSPADRKSLEDLLRECER